MIRSKALKHAGRSIPYRVEHRKSVTRRIHLRTDADGSLLIIAPRRMSRRAIHDTLQERVHRVVEFLAGARKRLAETPRPAYSDGEAHLYLGEPLALELVESAGGRGVVRLTAKTIRIESADLGPDRVRTLLENWYRQRANDYFHACMNELAARAPWIEEGPPRFRLRKMKRTWGNCSAKRGITLNTRLIKAPPHCIDYVIAHELCHLREMNHGKAFYALQSALYPDWRAVRSELREKAHLYLGS
jgi:predicted metal-dependent hydrolase